jgi:hypothetical protein
VQRTAGQGAHRVTFAPDREPGIWKVWSRQMKVNEQFPNSGNVALLLQIGG